MKEFSLAYDYRDDKHDPLYPIPKTANEELYRSYREEALKYKQLVLAGRLADYKYFTMAETIENALRIAKELKSSS